MNKNGKQFLRREKSRKKKTFRLAVFILTVFLIINGVVLIRNISRSTYRGTYEYSIMKDSLERQDYPMVSYMVGVNESRNFQTLKNAEGFSDFADFYQAAFLYRAYEEAGNEEKAKELLAKVNEKMILLEETEDFKQAVDRVKTLYGIG